MRFTKSRIAGAVVGGCTLMAACGAIYPWTALLFLPGERPGETRMEAIGAFNSVERCRSMALGEIDKRGLTGKAHYSCGYDCAKKGDTFICKAMQR